MRKNTYLSLVIFLTSFIYDYQNLASQKVTETYYSPITLEKGLQAVVHGIMEFADAQEEEYFAAMELYPQVVSVK